MAELTAAAFIGHGSPMNTLELNDHTAVWRALGVSLPRPRAVLCVSAHWYTNTTAVTAMAVPRVIHDFYGFPDELFAFDYPAPGSPEVADEVVEVLAPRWAGLDLDSWGIDHGTWSVLAHVFPGAEVPVLQLSIDANLPYADHFDIGRRLAPLRERGVLILGSGNIVHNLGRLRWEAEGQGEDWAHRFDEAARHALLDDPGSVTGLDAHPDHPVAVPTPDHFLPFVYFAGLAAESGTAPEVLVEGCTMGSLSMTSFTLDARCETGHHADTAASVPDPDVVPPKHTNL